MSRIAASKLASAASGRVQFLQRIAAIVERFEIVRSKRNGRIIMAQRHLETREAGIERAGDIAQHFAMREAPDQCFGPVGTLRPAALAVERDKAVERLLRRILDSGRQQRLKLGLRLPIAGEALQHLAVEPLRFGSIALGGKGAGPAEGLVDGHLHENAASSFII